MDIMIPPHLRKCYNPKDSLPLSKSFQGWHNYPPRRNTWRKRYAHYIPSPIRRLSASPLKKEYLSFSLNVPGGFVGDIPFPLFGFWRQLSLTNDIQLATATTGVRIRNCGLQGHTVVKKKIKADYLMLYKNEGFEK